MAINLRIAKFNHNYFQMRQLAKTYVRNPILAVAIFALISPTHNTHASDDIQQINLGPYAFYVPKDWMLDQTTVTASRPPNIRFNKLQSTPFDATELGLQPRSGWPKPYSSNELPRNIVFNYVPGQGPLTVDAKTKEWLAQTKSQEADSDGFVRISLGAPTPSNPPAFEIFIYKGYLDKFGLPLVVELVNTSTPSGERYLSFVPDAALQPDMWVRYDFDNTKFPKNTWWRLYQRMLALAEYLQTPK